MKRTVQTILIIIVLAAVVYWGAARLKADTPERIVEQVNKMEEPVPNLKLISAVWVDQRIVVQAQYIGTADQAPASAPEWHELASLCAERIYRAIGETYPTEVQLFQNQLFRAVAIVGL